MRDQAFWVLWGMAAGMLFDSVVLVATTAWLTGFTPFPIMIGGALGGIGAWLFSKRRGSPARRRQINPLWIILVAWPLCLFGPIAARWLQLYAEARTIPTCPTCQDGKIVDVDVLAFDNQPGYSLAFRTNQPKRATAFYRRELRKRGWRPVPARQLLDGWRMFAYRKPRRYLVVSAPSMIGRGDARSHHISIRCCAENFTYQCGDHR
jgi:hypothetical protein